VLNVIYDDVKGNKPPSIGVLFGTHNWKSCEKVLQSIQRAGLGEKDQDDRVVINPVLQGRVMIGQLYGSSAHGLLSFLSET
jgi:proline dehydrogenase